MTTREYACQSQNYREECCDKLAEQAVAFRVMARTPAQRGRFGRWLTAEREARYKRQSDALEAMRRLAGLHITPSEYAQWESGSRVPREDNPKVARLYEFFGSRPDDAVPVVEDSDLTELVAAIRGQTEAINALVLRLDGIASGAIREGVEDALREAEQGQADAASRGAQLLERPA